MNTPNVRKSILAGTWYPGSNRELKATVDRYLANVPPALQVGDLIGLIAPHAGYVYSGQVAAYAYKQVQGLHPFDVVVVVSPLHRQYHGDFAINESDGYETPLGLVQVDRDLIDALSGKLQVSPVRVDDEHSIEIQLPFLQRTLSGFTLLPIMQGNQSLDACRALSEALAGVLQDKKALLIGSTDLSHFHSYDRAVQLDRIVQDHVNSNDAMGLADSLAAGRSEACGGGPVICVMLAAQALGADQAKVLHYANSGDVTGDRSRVVGYLAAALYRSSEGSDHN